MFEKTAKSNNEDNIKEVQSNIEHLKIVAGVDAGSTGTRVALIDMQDYERLGLEDVDYEAVELFAASSVIPSSFALLDDERELLPKSGALQYNYDSHINLVKCASAEPYIKRVRVIRGQKIKDAAGAVIRFMDSGTPKTKNIVFYINVLDALGYSILRKYSGNIPKSVDVALGISVRPNELGTVYQSILLNNLKGTYTFAWKDIKFDIFVSDVIATTEPEAQIEGSATMYSLMSDVFSNREPNKSREYAKIADMLVEPSNYIHIEGGGSSVGVEVVKANEDGELMVMSACSRTFNIGGNFLMRTAKDQIRDTMGRTPSDASAEDAIKTALLKNGRNTDDVTPLIKATKQKVAEAIFEKFKHEVIDVNADIDLSDMDFIAMAGNLFSKGECNISIVDYFRKLVKQVSPNTLVLNLPENFIPQGNALRVLRDIDVFGE